MLRFSRYPLAIIGLVLLTISPLGCGDDPEAPCTSCDEPLLTVELGPWFLKNFAEEGIVFLSDAGGEVLDVATWSGPSTVELGGGGARPDSVSVTFVRERGVGIDLSTEIGVPAGTRMSWDEGYPHNPTGEATLILENVPAHDDYLIASSLAGTKPPTPFSPTQTIQVHWDAVDVFVRFDPVGGWPVGGWTWGVQVGETRALDLAEPGALAPLVRHATSVPAGDSITAHLTYSVRSGLAEQAFSFSFDTYSDGLPDSVIMFGPNIDPDLQESFFYHVTEGDPDVFCKLSVRGDVPTEFTEMPGTLTIGSADPDSAVFTMSGDWERFVAYWTRTAGPPGEWYVDGRAPLRTYALPRLPQEVLDLAPDLDREEHALRTLRVENETEPGVVYEKGYFLTVAKEGDGDVPVPMRGGLPLRSQW